MHLAPQSPHPNLSFVPTTDVLLVTTTFQNVPNTSPSQSFSKLSKASRLRLLQGLWILIRLGMRCWMSFSARFVMIQSRNLLQGIVDIRFVGIVILWRWKVWDVMEGAVRFVGGMNRSMRWIFGCTSLLILLWGLHGGRDRRLGRSLIIWILSAISCRTEGDSGWKEVMSNEFMNSCLNVLDLRLEVSLVSCLNVLDLCFGIVFVSCLNEFNYVLVYHVRYF